MRATDRARPEGASDRLTFAQLTVQKARRQVAYQWYIRSIAASSVPQASTLAQYVPRAR
jgi:hypothetical protein